MGKNVAVIEFGYGCGGVGSQFFNITINSNFPVLAKIE